MQNPFHVCRLLSHLQVAVSSQPFSLISFVSPDDVASFVALEIPWGNQNDVSLSYPHSSFHLSSDSAEALLTVLTVDQKSIVTQHFFSYADDIVSHGQHLDAILFFAFDLSFAHSTTSSLPFSRRMN
jgi:hypothetical protein